MSKDLKILIVEDTATDIELAVLVLRKTWPGLTHRSVETEAQFRAALDWGPDAIVADYEVPGFGAVAALDILRELGSDIPLIVFTGAVREEIVVRCMRLGAADYLLKDRLTRLASAIDNALAMRRERREKERTEHEQQRLAELNSAILNSLPALIALLDARGHIIAVNEAWRASRHSAGLANPAWGIGSDYVNLCARLDKERVSDAAAVAQGLKEVLLGARDSFSIEYAIHTTAVKRWFRMVGTPVSGGGAVVMHLDVTDRKSAEEQLKINANALRHLSEGVVITDANLCVVTVNQAFVGITGYLQRQVTGRPVATLTAQDQSHAFMQLIKATVTQRGSWKGELPVRRKSGEVFPALFSFSAVRSESGAVEYFTAVFSDLSSVRAAERQVEFLSQHDALTALPNRTALQQRLHQAIATHDPQQGAPVLLLIELDRFKTVNDTLGHPIGDALLCGVAKRLSNHIGSNEMLARLGGDEFVVLVPQLRTPEEIAAVAEHMRSTLERPFNIGTHELFITASIGVSCYPHDGRDFEAMLRTADAAVYRAKRSGRNTISFYSAEMDAAAQERFLLQNTLPQALARGEFILEYQPTIDLKNNVVTGVEALIRWRHPQLGMVPPGHFIDLAEDTGLIIPISEWVLRTALIQAKRWIAAGWSRAAVAVNLSVRQFAQPDLAARIAETIESVGMQPSRIRLEVTESMVMEDPILAAATLERLSRMGIQIALDDFGTGYSSLSYLKRFRLGCLKVDRSFVSGTPGDAGDESIVHAVVALGKTLGMKIVAEGVETRAQANFLRAAGCDDAQGFYYARPVDSEEVLRLVSTIPDQHRDDALMQPDLLS